MPLSTVTVDMVRGAVLDGIPTLFTAEGKGIPSAVIESSILAAQHKVSNDLNILIGLHTVMCVRDKPDEDTLADDVLLEDPLDKPRNWFKGDRFGDLPLPHRPVKKVTRVRFLPYGWAATPVEFDVERIRVQDDSIQFVPGPMGYFFPLSGVFPAYQMADGSANPGSIEVTYQAGLSARDLRLRYPLIPKLIELQAAIITLSQVQGRVGGGVAKEAAGADGLQNTVDLGRVDVLGPLGGIIKGLKANYNELLNSARAGLGGTVSLTFL